MEIVKKNLLILVISAGFVAQIEKKLCAEALHFSSSVIIFGRSKCKHAVIVSCFQLQCKIKRFILAKHLSLEVLGCLIETCNVCLRIKSSTLYKAVKICVYSTYSVVYLKMTQVLSDARKTACCIQEVEMKQNFFDLCFVCGSWNLHLVACNRINGNVPGPQ